ncbi:hypothetical protein BSL78_19293 [Apostichopus japonicus]|uniref:Uncharacterized protein n=1 Tax=Stichopus japonicus TaxID=307972 RepID=A0A2G8K767_STIJA|nr:hypothetical protein BSL78_19293 [Apostichopus japonicus]
MLQVDPDFICLTFTQVNVKEPTAVTPARPPSPVVTNSNARPACSTVQNNLQTGILEYHEQPIQKRLHKRRPVPTLRLTSNQRTMTEPREVPTPSLFQKVEPLHGVSLRHAVISEEQTPRSAKDHTTKSVSIPRESRERSRSPVCRSSPILDGTSSDSDRGLRRNPRPVRQGHIRRSSM